MKLKRGGSSADLQPVWRESLTWARTAGPVRNQLMTNVINRSRSGQSCVKVRRRWVWCASLMI